MKVRRALGPRKCSQVIDIRSPLRLTYHFPCILKKARPNISTAHLWSRFWVALGEKRPILQSSRYTIEPIVNVSLEIFNGTGEQCIHLLKRLLNNLTTSVASSRS